MRSGALQVLSGDVGTDCVSGLHLCGLRNAIVELRRRQCSAAAWVPLVVQLGRRLGAAGRWAAGAELFHGACQALEIGGGARVELLTAASTFLINKVYTYTYITDGDDAITDAICALEFAKKATASVSTSAVAARVESLFAEGRSSAICGQVKAFRTCKEEQATALPSALELVIRGQDCFMSSVGGVYGTCRSTGQDQSALL